ncbi:glycoside hydrolase domain-containing protein [Micromonospora sp. NPDC049523]|uniref:glycoside hydrolase domain-containing protein n=1 Tax=Micromonospora sp. NPDC049523 TaxID=3155921 RepID=UPI00343823CF
MDQKVLEAQQWVNATYGGVAGFETVTENGKTGWATMYALTRALQHELGITALSDSFGPTTLGLLAARGGVKLTESNQNIIRIIQCACYCKGYEPGGISGVFTLDTQFAVTGLMINAGLGDRLGGVVQPKVVKALLTMDAYVVLAGGTESVREIQQWMNGRYFSRANFFVIPCDGIFSRAVQQALYLAIQYELGMSDEQATGVFGPGTQAGLRAHQLTEGNTGIFVSIFSASMVFNRVRLEEDQSTYSTFTDHYDAALTTAVGDFQRFSALPVNGQADFATWCQLLVSHGDQSRPGTAVDCITTITPERAQALRAARYEIVGRYLDEQPWGTLNKRIQPGELATIFQNGLRVFPISQYYGEELSYFTYSQGYQDALGAHAAAVGYGFNAGTVIYFAVDYDATQEDIDSNIVPYFYGVVAGLAGQGKRYVHGVYASRNVCQQVTLRTYARWSFVSGMSAGYSGNMGFPLPENWAFNQIQTLWVGSGSGSINVDKNVHRPKSDLGVSSVNDPSAPFGDFVTYVERLFQIAVMYGGNVNPSQRVLEFLRHKDYGDALWAGLIGDVDRAFIAHVLDIRVPVVERFRDPFYGVDVMVSHLAASCNGVYLQGRPPGTTTNRGDVAGWAGDWMTFYGEWRRDSHSYSSGYTYCMERLAKVDGVGTFKLRDLIEDSDAYNIGMSVRGGTNIVAAVHANYWGEGYLSRFKRFYEGRFGSAQDAKEIARQILTFDDDLVVSAGRAYLIQSTGGIPTLMPHLLPDDKLDEFCQGFSDMLLANVGLEDARVAALRAQGGH